MSKPHTNTEPTDDLFTAWLRQTPGRTRALGRRPFQPQGGPRFAPYGRMSTTGYQDPATSRQWQRDNATTLIAGHGVIVAEFYDAGYSRSLPWHQRPAAAALLTEAAQPGRRFDAVVIGEYERAFTGQQGPAGHHRHLVAKHCDLHRISGRHRTAPQHPQNTPNDHQCQGASDHTIEPAVRQLPGAAPSP